jgi:hypothetical protein
MSSRGQAAAGGPGRRARRIQGSAAAFGAGLALLALRPAGSQPPAREASVGRQESSFTLRDERLAGAPLTRYWEVFVPREGTLARAQKDPKFGRDFPQQCVVRVWNSPAGEKDTRFYVHFDRAEDEPLARRVGAVLARLHWLAIEYLRLIPDPNDRDAQTTHVWLTREGRPGGEEFKRNVYLYAVAEDRAPAEWVREIAHEYSHVVLPAFGPYSSPERWANGYLGERLFVKWLIDNEQTDLWGTPFLGSAYLANQVTPLRDRFLNAGPLSPAGQQTDGAGMEHFIGFALAMEAACGPRVLRDGLPRAPFNAPAALASGIADVFRTPREGAVMIDARACVPELSTVETVLRDGIRARRAAYWLFLPSGSWTLNLEGPSLSGVDAQVESAITRALLASGAGRAQVEARAETGAWRRLRVTAGPLGVFELRQIRLARAGS